MIDLYFYLDEYNDIKISSELYDYTESDIVNYHKHLSLVTCVLGWASFEYENEILIDDNRFYTYTDYWCDKLCGTLLEGYCLKNKHKLSERIVDFLVDKVDLRVLAFCAEIPQYSLDRLEKLNKFEMNTLMYYQNLSCDFLEKHISVIDRDIMICASKLIWNERKHMMFGMDKYTTHDWKFTVGKPIQMYITHEIPKITKFRDCRFKFV